MIHYNGNLTYNDNFSAALTASAFFGALKYRIVYNNSDESGLYLFGFKIRDIKENKPKDNEEKDSDSKVKDRFQNILRKTIDILNDDLTRKSFKAIKTNLVKLIRHIFPKEVSGRFVFGFEDPYYTGKLLELFALLYAGAGEALYVEPVWEKHKFEADLKFSGRMWVLYILVIFLKLILNKDFKEFRRKYLYGK